MKPRRTAGAKQAGECRMSMVSGPVSWPPHSTPEFRAIAQFQEQPGVGSRERMIPQLFRTNPSNRLAADGSRFMVQEGTTEKSQLDGFLRIPMRDGFHQLAYAHLDTQFLPEFTPQAFLIRFPRLTFTAGKLPQPAQMVLGSSLSDEEFATAENQAGSNLDGCMRYEG